MWRGRGVFFFTLLLIRSACATDFIAEARRQKLSEDPQWHRLLHYHGGLFGGEKSDIDGKNFFLSKHGRTDPEGELEATINAFFEPMPGSTETQHPRCRYPARFDWLNERLHLDSALPPMTCERYESWREKIDPASLSIVFAGYYVNNPSSMYGHTFLRVGQSSDQAADKPLLDYTINFAAMANSRNGIAFAVLGLTGGYPGTFSAVPYYMKVQFYNNLESRDLWEYKLNISSTGVDRLIRHLWEMGPTSMSYYFLNKNCSYQLLPMLEVADPSLHLSEPFRFRAIPVDTLRAVIDYPGLLAGAVFRSSAQRRMIASRDGLLPGERKIAEKFVVGKIPPTQTEMSTLTVERQRAVLDTAYEYLHYRAGFYRDQPKKVQDRERTILLGLNALPASTVPPMAISEPAPPQAAHKSCLLGLGVGATRDTSYEEFSTRGALHDLVEDPAGFVEGSQLEMFALRLRFQNDRPKAYVEDATGVEVQSLAPWQPWIHNNSWKLKINYSRAHDLDQNPEGSGQAGISGGSGLSLRIPRVREGIVYAMLDADGEVGGVFRDNYRLGVGPCVGIVGAIAGPWRAHFIASYIRYGAGNISNANILRLTQSVQLSKSYQVRLNLERQNHYRDGTLSINRYF